MSKNGMWGGQSSKNFRQSLSYLPDPKTQYTINFNDLSGGLNVYDLDYQLSSRESPDIRNLHWRDGALGCRPGQSWLINNESAGEIGYTMFDQLFWGYAFVHIGSEIRCFDPTFDPTAETEPTFTAIVTGVPENRGTFFRYQDYLMYKNRGGYFRIQYNADGTTPETMFTGGAIGSEAFPAYTPTTYINCDPATGAGDSYQPENRLSSVKTVWYTPSTTATTASFTGDGETTVFTLASSRSSQAGLYAIGLIYIGTTLQYEGTNYTGSLTDGTITFTTAPSDGAEITVNYTVCGYEYYLPVRDEDTTIVSITVDGAVETDYEFDAASGKITFAHSPMRTVPITVNTVHITYSLANTDAYNSVMDCPYAINYGGGQNLCIVVGGCTAQPNAYFWNGNNIAMDESYFPMEQYNLAGDTEENITGFGKQQSYLIVFKERSIGRTSMSTTTVDASSDTTAREYITFDYTPINARIGCTYPWSIQLCENNLVFVSREYGVCILLDSSAAYEMNILPMSKKIDGSTTKASSLYLKYDLSADPDHVCSAYYDNCYHLTVNGHTYLWDAELSGYDDPSWFFYTNVNGVAYLETPDYLYHINSKGSISVYLIGSYVDYDEAIEKVYQFATQNMGNYMRLKDVRSVIFVIRGDTDADTSILYDTDYENRYDLTDIVSRSWRLVPRNLSYRGLAVVKYAVVVRRDPMCRHVRHFMMRLENKGLGEDLSVISAQIMYTFTGRER